MSEPMTTLARNAEERWNFAKKIDREFNRNMLVLSLSSLSLSSLFSLSHSLSLPPSLEGAEQYPCTLAYTSPMKGGLSFLVVGYVNQAKATLLKDKIQHFNTIKIRRPMQRCTPIVVGG